MINSRGRHSNASLHARHQSVYLSLKAVSARFVQYYVGDVVISAITFAELEFGVSVCADPERERRNLDALIELIAVKPFNTTAARSYGPVNSATREKQSDHLDKVIAAHAIALGATLVTNHERDFEAYPTLIVENWLKP